jgi:hypothetical protein
MRRNGHLSCFRANKLARGSEMKRFHWTSVLIAMVAVLFVAGWTGCAAPQAKPAEHPQSEHPKGDHPHGKQGEHPKGEHPHGKQGEHPKGEHPKAAPASQPTDKDKKKSEHPQGEHPK